MQPINIIGIPYDQKSSYLRGSALAPPLIRQTLYSEAYNNFAENGISIRNPLIVDKGDFSIENYFDIEKIAAQQLENDSRLLTFGGDHSITYPLLRAFRQYHSSIQILHIDAHADLYDEFEGDRYSHACPFARIMEENLADRLVQVGIRTLTPHQREQAARFGVEIIEMKDFVLHKIPDFSAPIYISLDLDAIDPAFAPGVSHQESGGFTPREVIAMIQKIKAPIIGADIVEYNPVRDSNNVTAALAAKMAREMLAIMMANDSK